MTIVITSYPQILINASLSSFAPANVIAYQVISICAVLLD
jgi:hypothetical protein